MTSSNDQETRLEPVYNFLVDYIRQYGYAPSLREIAAHCHISPATATHYLDRLQVKGLLMRTDGRARSITLKNSVEQK